MVEAIWRLTTYRNCRRDTTDQTLLFGTIVLCCWAFSKHLVPIIALWLMICKNFISSSQLQKTVSGAHSTNQHEITGNVCTCSVKGNGRSSSQVHLLLWETPGREAVVEILYRRTQMFNGNMARECFGLCWKRSPFMEDEASIVGPGKDALPSLIPTQKRKGSRVNRRGHTIRLWAITTASQRRQALWQALRRILLLTLFFHVHVLSSAF